uniref:monocarboxylate transporter 4-like n=1 Tax=Styela clava TaxID=7725 RepID=UPI00193A117B|nr:monocarboxylate transporter 4-like [Styela clava]
MKIRARRKRYDFTTGGGRGERYDKYIPTVSSSDVKFQTSSEHSPTLERNEPFKKLSFTHSEYGARGWVVVFACFMVEGLCFGTMRALPVYFLEMQTAFHATSSQISWMLSLNLAVLHISGPVSSILCEKYGCRIVVMIGGLLASIGFVITSFSKHIAFIYIGNGVITGIGFGCAFVSANTAVGQYFRRNSSFAYCLSAVGGPMMGFVLAPLFEILNNMYGWRGAFLMISGLTLHICAAGMVMLRPEDKCIPDETKETCVTKSNIKDKPKKEQQEEECSTSREKNRLRTIPEEETSIDDSCMMNPSFVPCDDDDEIVYLPESCSQDVSDEISSESSILRLLKNVRFIAFCFNGVCIGAGAFTAPLFLVPHAVSLGFNLWDSSVLVSISSAVSIASSLFAGWVSAFPNVNILYVDAAAFAFHSVNCFFCHVVTTYNGLIVYAVGQGFGTGIILALAFSILAGIVGTECLSKGIGLFLLITSVSVLLTPPTAGWLADRTETYSSAFYLTGLASAVGFAVIIVIICLPITDSEEQSKADGVNVSLEVNTISGRSKNPGAGISSTTDNGSPYERSQEPVRRMSLFGYTAYPIPYRQIGKHSNTAVVKKKHERSKSDGQIMIPPFIRRQCKRHSIY